MAVYNQKFICELLNISTSELLNISAETMNSIVEDIIDLLQEKLHLSSPYRSVCNKFVMFL